MISGLSFDYAHARVAARIGRRPDEGTWNLLHTARDIAALLELARAGTAGPLVHGVAWPATLAEVESALRQVLRARIREVAGWSPGPWQAAILWTLHLIDLPALVCLLDDAPEPSWIAGDGQLAAWVEAKRARRLGTALRSSALAPIASALEQGAGANRAGPLHPVLASWQRAWRNRWPRIGGDAARGLEELERLIVGHIERFAGAGVGDAPRLRAELDHATTALWRRHPAQPAGLFAALALFALDMERMRAELTTRGVQ